MSRIDRAPTLGPRLCERCASEAGTSGMVDIAIWKRDRELLRHLLTAHRVCERGCEFHERAAAARKRLGT